MLLNRNGLIKEYYINKDIPEEFNMDCWIKEEADANFNIYIFTIEVISQNLLNEYWEKINNNISINFQSVLKKSIERWNIYLIYIVKDKIEDRLKYEIEQNKYATRKIIFDNNFKEIFSLQGYERQNLIDEIIEKKLFIIEIKPIQLIDGPKLKERVRNLSPLYAKLLEDPSDNLNRVEVLMEVIKNV